ncbi:hypothetical protein CHS0354_031704 [Potamilus streckersoni]|uniref:Nose resistant-to-fluoxetine protein N-terminal domain-containing protein n=1 Tax=Potamilus streckersoni TaxID=2493646 RepID=A0AAE0TB86_9BIVA|nr:hypothetical protein CHS0354_031704 [Potamilus streckersoni]
MNLKTTWTLLLLLGLVCQTYSHDAVSTEDLSKLQKELQKLQLLLESIAMDGFPPSEIITYPASTDIRKNASLMADGLRVDASPGYNVSDTCLNHTAILTEALKRKEEWAIRFVDAIGKPQSGIFDGNRIWPGSYDECINTQAVVYLDPSNKLGPSYPYMGQYCSASIPLLILQSVTVGICVPESCNDDDAAALVRTALSIYVSASINPTVQCHERNREFDGRATAVT